MGNSYYHVTDFETVLKILHQGLKADDEGYIYLLTRKDIVSHVAVTQLGFFKTYALLRINAKGIKAEIEDNNVAELTAPYQKRVKQSLIYKSYIKLSGVYTVKHKKEGGNHGSI